MSESPKKAVLIKPLHEVTAECLADDHFAAIRQTKEREFGRAVCAALIQLAAAFWRYYVGGEPPFVRGK